MPAALTQGRLPESEAIMPTVERLLGDKGARVITIEPSATVLDAAKLMNEHRIGSLVVINRAATARSGKGGASEQEVVVGMFTERDVLTRVVAAKQDPSATRVGDVMTTPVLTCGSRTTLEELRRVMREKRIRHMPVLNDESALCGMVSIGDLNTAKEAVMEETIRMLEIYSYRP
ncbi:MAG: CBS domain-containing protein [Phycisphaerales bacterium]|nr:CBS domain-containing protein [Phycisphaerales bacterium]